MADAVAAPDDEDAAIGKELKRRRRLAAANRRAKESSTDESDASVGSEEEEGEKAAKDGEKEVVGAAASPAKATSVEAVASVDGLEATEQAGEFVKTADGWEWKGDGSEPSEKVQRSNGGIWGRLCGWGLCGRGSRLEEEDDD